jgi:HlyD family secretion protein
MAYWKARHKPQFRQAEVVEGEIISVVNATGRVEPVSSVHIGSVVSGPIDRLYVDFNSVVKKGDPLAQIDERIYKAAKAADEALLKTRKAEVSRVKALLEQARNDETRAKALYKENPDYISDAELDQVTYTRRSLEAQLEVAEAAVDQAQGNLDNSVANLGYTLIESPVDGIVIERKIDPGQTLAAQFQTPELFVVAEEMDKRMFVYASIDEADIGLIRKAETRDERVEFTVDAYPDDLFEGKIFQVRINPTETQNVVTYPVVVEAPNPDMKLLPGMTANLSFHIENREDIVKIPNAALRFYPKKEQVRPQDHKLLDGTEVEEDEEDAGTNEEQISAVDRIEANRQRDKRHVWVVEGDYLHAIEVETGISDNKYTELITGPIDVGQKLVTGVRTSG